MCGKFILNELTGKSYVSVPSLEAFVEEAGPGGPPICWKMDCEAGVQPTPRKYLCPEGEDHDLPSCWGQGLVSLCIQSMMPCAQWSLQTAQCRQTGPLDLYITLTDGAEGVLLDTTGHCTQEERLESASGHKPMLS